MPSAYPVGAESGILAAAELRDEQSLESLLASVEKGHSRGRVSRGLARVAQSYLAALREDYEKAERSFIECEDLWAKTNEPMTLAYARAVLAMLLGPESEFGVTKLAEATEFFEEHEIRGQLEGIMSRVPQASAVAAG